jgi:hypothetical protein
VFKVQLDKPPDDSIRVLGPDKHVETASLPRLTATETTANANIESARLLSVDAFSSGFETNSVDGVLGTPLAAAGHTDVEFPGHIREVVVSSQFCGDLVQHRLCVDKLVFVAAGDRTAGNVPHRVAARRPRRKTDPLEFLPYCWNIL